MIYCIYGGDCFVVKYSEQGCGFTELLTVMVDAPPRKTALQDAADLVLQEEGFRL